MPMLLEQNSTLVILVLGCRDHPWYLKLINIAMHILIHAAYKWKAQLESDVIVIRRKEEVWIDSLVTV